jgi:hypothetical protein
MQKLPDSCVVRNYSCVVRNYQSSFFTLFALVFCGFFQKPSAGIHILKEY